MLILTNKSDKNTPIIQNLQTFNGKVTQTQNLPCILHTLRGSDAKINDFEPLSLMLRPNKNKKIAPKNGRSSNTSAFPFFNLEIVGFGDCLYQLVGQVNGKPSSCKKATMK